MVTHKLKLPLFVRHHGTTTLQMYMLHPPHLWYQNWAFHFCFYLKKRSKAGLGAWLLQVFNVVPHLCLVTLNSLRYVIRNPTLVHTCNMAERRTLSLEQKSQLFSSQNLGLQFSTLTTWQLVLPIPPPPSNPLSSFSAYSCLPGRANCLGGCHCEYRYVSLEDKHSVSHCVWLHLMN